MDRSYFGTVSFGFHVQSYSGGRLTENHNMLPLKRLFPLQLELRMSRCSGEGDDLADIGDPGNELDQALESQAESGMGD